MIEDKPKSRLSAMRDMKVGDSIFVNRILPEDATANDARDVCRNRIRSICSSVNLLRKEGMKLETSSGVTFLTNGRLACVLVVERVG